MAHDSPDPDPIARALGTAPDPRDAAGAAEARAILAGLDGLAVPAEHLPGWQSLCAAEYGEAVAGLRRALVVTRGALAAAARAAR